MNEIKPIFYMGQGTVHTSSSCIPSRSGRRCDLSPHSHSCMPFLSNLLLLVLQFCPLSDEMGTRKTLPSSIWHRHIDFWFMTLMESTTTRTSFWRWYLILSARICCSCSSAPPVTGATLLLSLTTLSCSERTIRASAAHYTKEVCVHTCSLYPGPSMYRSSAGILAGRLM